MMALFGFRARMRRAMKRDKDMTATSAVGAPRATPSRPLGPGRESPCRAERRPIGRQTALAAGSQLAIFPSDLRQGREERSADGRGVRGAIRHGLRRRHRLQLHQLLSHWLALRLALSRLLPSRGDRVRQDRCLWLLLCARSTLPNRLDPALALGADLFSDHLQPTEPRRSRARASATPSWSRSRSGPGARPSHVYARGAALAR